MGADAGAYTVGALGKSQEKTSGAIDSWWSKDGLGTASLGLRSLGLYDICPHVYRVPVGASVCVRS